MKKNYLLILTLVSINALSMDHALKKSSPCKQLPPEIWYMIVQELISATDHQQEARTSLKTFKIVDKKSYTLIAQNKNKLVSIVNQKEQPVTYLKKCVLKIACFFEKINYHLEPSHSSHPKPFITWQR